MYWKIHFLVPLILCSLLSIGQSADEIINAAVKKTGGVSKWEALQGFKINAKFDQGGVEFPLEVVQLKDGRKYTRLEFQGTEIMQGVFDGTTLWSTNFQMQKAERANPEAIANLKLDANDFPDALLNYSNKGYSVELMGEENFEGIETYKVKLIREPMLVDGDRIDDIVYYYFDVGTFFPVGREFEMKHGPISGSIMVIRLDDYREVKGLYFPFSMSQGVKDAPAQPIIVESIELNPTIRNKDFAFPGK